MSDSMDHVVPTEKGSKIVLAKFQTISFVIGSLVTFFVFGSMGYNDAFGPKPIFKVTLWSGGSPIRTYFTNEYPKFGGGIFDGSKAVSFWEKETNVHRDITGTITVDLMESTPVK